MSNLDKFAYLEWEIQMFPDQDIIHLETSPSHIASCFQTASSLF
jgi:hypothetical protein